jgi:hypothetical protein
MVYISVPFSFDPATVFHVPMEFALVCPRVGVKELAAASNAPLRPLALKHTPVRVRQLAEAGALIQLPLSVVLHHAAPASQWPQLHPLPVPLAVLEFPIVLGAVGPTVAALALHFVVRPDPVVDIPIFPLALALAMPLVIEPFARI